MRVCSHCGNNIEEHHKYCPLCGKNQEIKVKKGVSYKTLSIVLGIVILLIILFFIFGGSKELVGKVIGIDTSSFSQKALEKESCPYECCLGEGYKEKGCSVDFECVKNKCVAIDSDGDNLADIEEKQEMERILLSLTI